MLLRLRLAIVVPNDTWFRGSDGCRGKAEDAPNRASLLEMNCAPIVKVVTDARPVAACPPIVKRLDTWPLFINWLLRLARNRRETEETVGNVIK